RWPAVAVVGCPSQASCDADVAGPVLKRPARLDLHDNGSACAIERVAHRGPGTADNDGRPGKQRDLLPDRHGFRPDDLESPAAQDRLQFFLGQEYPLLVAMPRYVDLPVAATFTTER